VIDLRFREIRNESERCLRHAEDAEKAFNDSLLIFAELHAASAQQLGTANAWDEANASLRLQMEIEKYHNEDGRSAAEKAAKKNAVDAGRS
jgi:hypothetical protein